MFFKCMPWLSFQTADRQCTATGKGGGSTTGGTGTSSSFYGDFIYLEGHGAIFFSIFEIIAFLNHGMPYQ